MKGFRTVFSFSLKQLISNGSYKKVTAVFAVILFLLPAILIPAIAGSREEEGEPEITVKRVYYVNESTSLTGEPMIPPELAGTEFLVGGTAADAEERLRSDSEALLLRLTEDENSFQLELTVPEESPYSESELSMLLSCLYPGFEAMRLQAVPAAIPALFAEIRVELPESGAAADDEDPEENQFEPAREVINFLLPYLNTMVVYFLVLFYGRSASNSVILEKSSKLMDTFLVCVKPAAMLFGKVAAECAAAIMQFLIWAASFLGGAAAGLGIAKSMHPEKMQALWEYLHLLKEAVFSISLDRVIPAVLLVLGSFFLYNALAAIGGSLASNTTELASTNGFFTLILIVSFLLTLYTGVLGGNTVTGAQILDFIPFSAVLQTPAGLLTGRVTPAQGFLSFGILAAVTAVLLYLAGRIYVMMALYKGKPPKPAQILRMLKENRRKETV